MPDSISHPSYLEEGRRLRWSYNSQLIDRVFDSPVKAVPLQSGSGLLVVEPASNDAPNNAIILNGDGSLRTRVKNPEAGTGAICFGDAYYVRDELTLIICFASWQMACVVDEAGKVVRTYEAR